MPNLFGEIDAAEVPDDPFYVPPGTYDCIVVDASFVTRKDGTGHGLSIKYQIEDDKSDYENNIVQEWKNVYPDLTAEQLQSDSDIRRHLSFLKQRLGQLGVPEGEMNGILDNLDSLIGIKCVVQVTESKSQDGSRTFTNVRNVYIPEDDFTPEIPEGLSN